MSMSVIADDILDFCIDSDNISDWMTLSSFVNGDSWFGSLKDKSGKLFQLIVLLSKWYPMRVIQRSHDLTFSLVFSNNRSRAWVW